MASDTGASNFNASLGCLLLPAMEELATRLERVTGISAGERDLVVSATHEALQAVLARKLTRLLVLELNAARVTGRLDGADAAQRWTQFLALSSQRAFWDGLKGPYPTLLPRVETILRNRCAASLRFAERWAAGRDSLEDLCGAPPGELERLSFGAGDSHCGGQTVSLLQCQGGKLVYKPRPLAVDLALREFITELGAFHGGGMSIRVPRVALREDHGWAEFVPHRCASGRDELLDFYRGIGHWLAIMRLLGGSDLHAENLIAHGGSPVVVDCETLFTPKPPPHPSGLGHATDLASELVSGTVLSIGMLPGRGASLGWRGVDSSSVGMLPGQQPHLLQHGVVMAGTDEARIGTTQVQAPVAQNHPSPEPALARYWPEVLASFDAMTGTLRRLDAEGRLPALLARFTGCRIRVVTRSTEVYSELGRMLWHPVSLHKEAPPRQRAHELLKTMAANVSLAPSEPAVIDAEIQELLEGDIPVYTTVASNGRLEGPRGTFWLSPRNLVDAALEHWRAADFKLEKNVIQSALVSAYINDGWRPESAPRRSEQVRTDDPERSRRRIVARIMRDLASTAIHGGDGTVTWIAPVFQPTGWSVQPLERDLYGGTSGVALLLGAYLRETAAGRADAVDGLDALLAATLRTLDLAEARQREKRSRGVRLRPQAPGGYLGLGSQLWTRLVLAEWGLDRGDGVARAIALAEDIPEAAAADAIHDVLTGKAGAIPPLLMLARRTGDTRFVDMASALGDRLCEVAQRKGDGVVWTHENWPEGLGGFAHGVTGIGWALTRLARVTGSASHARTARAAFAFEESLFDEGEGNWLDVRLHHGQKTAAAWCHGSVGIGLAHADLDPTLEHPQTRLVLRRAAAATWRMGFGWNHCACHGDLGAWEVMDRALAAGEAPEGLTRAHLLGTVLTSIEEHGPSCGMTRETFVPSLLPGLGGVVYQLLRAHPESALPSILTVGGGDR